MKNLHLIILTSIVVLSGCATSEKPGLNDEIKAIENGLTNRIIVEGDSIQYFSIQERMKAYNIPGVSIAIVRDGKIRWAKGYGLANTKDSTVVNTETLFQAGSISKPVAALSVLKLLEEDKLDLDVNVNQYLKGWKVEENKFTDSADVTLRLLLTHSAGATVHGFPGYAQTDTFPSIREVLNGEGNTPRIYIDTIPGSFWRYSGGGYTIMEKVVEDVSGMPLEAYMEEHIFQPLGMNNSTYDQPLPEEYQAKASAAYNSKGEIIEGLWHNYPEQAAAGLWTTPTDLAKYCIAIQEILKGKESDVLFKETVEKMLTKHKNDWGLGPSLAWDGDSLRFQHGGKNAGFTNEMIAFAHKGDAVIVMTSADSGGRLIGEILRSVSKYYDWGIRNPKIVKLIELDAAKLDSYTGKYLYDGQVPGIGDYYIDVVREGNKLVVLDPNNDERDEMWPMDELKFIEIVNGNEMVFDPSSDTLGFMWNNQYQFYKVE